VLSARIPFLELLHVGLDELMHFPHVGRVSVQSLNPDGECRAIGSQKPGYHLLQFWPMVSGVAPYDANHAWLLSSFIGSMHVRRDVHMDEAMKNP
jgi:hypothetical protein